jgi:DHA1 family inner membrane transport protein
MPRALLSIASLGTFLATSTGIARSPFLLDMARDLGTSMAAIAHLFSMLALTWGAAALVAGVASDRWGRRALLAGGTTTQGSALIAMALSDSYFTIAIWNVIGAAGGGAYMGVVFAAVADRVPPAERGRALGWIINGQSFALLLAVPTASAIGALVGWRGVLVILGVALLALVAGLWLTLAPRRVAPPSSGESMRAWFGRMTDSRLALLLAAGVTERLGFAAIAIYMPTFLITTYAMSLATAALPIALVALGNVLGNAVGAKLADRVASRMSLFCVASLASALAAASLFLWDLGLVVAIAWGFVFAFVNALGRPAYMAVLSNVPEAMRGAVLGLNIACASAGWIGAASLGAILIESGGFTRLGVLVATIALLGAALSALPAARRFER